MVVPLQYEFDDVEFSTLATNSSPTTSSAPVPSDAIMYGQPLAISVQNDSQQTLYINEETEFAHMGNELQKESIFILWPSSSAQQKSIAEQMKGGKSSTEPVKWTDTFQVLQAFGESQMFSYQPQVFEGAGGKKREAFTADCPLILITDANAFPSHAAPRGIDWALDNLATSGGNTTSPFVRFSDAFYLINKQQGGTTATGSAGRLCVPNELACQNQSLLGGAGSLTLSDGGGQRCWGSNSKMNVKSSWFNPMRFYNLTQHPILNLINGAGPSVGPSAAPTTPTDQKHSDTWLYVALAIGGLVLLLAIVLVIILARRRPKTAMILTNPKQAITKPPVAPPAVIPVSPGFDLPTGPVQTTSPAPTTETATSFI